jgi:hypothetical protein
METGSSVAAEQKSPKLRWFQYRLRSRFVLTTLVAIACSWLTVTMQYQRKQKAAAEAIKEAGGKVVSERTWLGKLLRDNSLVTVTCVKFSRQPITDAGLVHLQGLSQLQRLDFDGTQVTDAGLARLQGWSQLQWLGVWKTTVTDEGLDKFRRALPNCQGMR